MSLRKDQSNTENSCRGFPDSLWLRSSEPDISARSLCLGIKDKYCRESGPELGFGYSTSIQVFCSWPGVNVPYSSSITIQAFDNRLCIQMPPRRPSSVLAFARGRGSPGLSDEAAWIGEAELRSKYSLEKRQWGNGSWRKTGLSRAETHSSHTVNQLSQNPW